MYISRKTYSVLNIPRLFNLKLICSTDFTKCLNLLPNMQLPFTRHTDLGQPIQVTKMETPAKYETKKNSLEIGKTQTDGTLSNLISLEN